MNGSKQYSGGGEERGMAGAAFSLQSGISPIEYSRLFTALRLPGMCSSEAANKDRKPLMPAL